MEKLKKINTQDINIAIVELLSNSRTKSAYGYGMWICARKDSVTFRPSYEKEYLFEYVKFWKRSLKENRIVVIPLVFYACDKDDREKVLLRTTEQSKILLYERDGAKQNNEEKEFIVVSHYNLILLYTLENEQIVVERYEPSNASLQGDLNEKLYGLFSRILGDDIIYTLVAEKGLQTVYHDKRLCSYHILYYLRYRLEHTLKETRDMLKNPPGVDSFSGFCQLLTETLDEIK